MPSGARHAATAGEDTSQIPAAFGVPYTYWGISGTGPQLYAAARREGAVQQEVPHNHGPAFAPVLQPRLETGVRALTVAALAWLAAPARGTGRLRN